MVSCYDQKLLFMVKFLDEVFLISMLLSVLAYFNVYKVEVMSCSHYAVAALLVALIVGVQGHQIIYVGNENGTLRMGHWIAASGKQG